MAAAWSRWRVALALVLLAGAGCGSRLDPTVLEASNGALTSASQIDRSSAASPLGSVASRRDAGAREVGTSGEPDGSQPGRAIGAVTRNVAAVGPAAAPAGQSQTAPAPTARAASGAATLQTNSQSTGRVGGASAAGPPGPAARATEPKPEIVLGTLGTASGVIGAATEPIVAATKAWGADVNARGGLKGHPVRIVFGDDGGDPARAAAIARRMVEQDKVIAFVGTYLVTTTPAVTTYLDQVQVPMIGGPGGNEIEDQSPMVFNPQMGADEALGHGLLNNIFVQSDKRKVAVLYCREASSCEAQARRVRQFAALYDMQVVFEAQVSIAQPDYTGEVLAARNAGADVIITSVDEASIVRLARSAHRQGYSPVIAGSYTVNNDVLLHAGADAEGLLGFSATAPYGSSPLLKPYREAVTRFVPGARLAGYGSTAWVQGKLMERLAVVFGEKPNPTTADVLDALYSLHDENLGGLVPPITFNHGPHGRVNRCMVPIKIGKGEIGAPLGERFVCARG